MKGPRKFVWNRRACNLILTFSANGFRFTTRSCINYNNVLSVCFVFCLNFMISNSTRLDEIPLAKTNEIIDIAMPGVRPTQDDHYLCTSNNIEAYGTQYINAFEPNSNADRAHHMILYTCDDVFEDLNENGWWECGHHFSVCANQKIVYAWAKNAPSTILPKDVGFRIGAESNIKNLVLQVHYAHPLPEGSKDLSGFRVFISPEEPIFLAGILLLYRSQLHIPPNTEKIHGDMNCELPSPSPIHPFAYRVHAHKLGVVVSGYKIDQKTGHFKEIGKGNPQWPQAFYPIKENITINPRDYIAAQCTYSTLHFNKSTEIGRTAEDEMCNFYVMFYTKSRDPLDHFITCDGETRPELMAHLPQDSDEPLPPNKTLEDFAKSHHSMDSAGTSQKPQKSYLKNLPGISEVDKELNNGDEEQIIKLVKDEENTKASLYQNGDEIQSKTDWPGSPFHKKNSMSSKEGIYFIEEDRKSIKLDEPLLNNSLQWAGIVVYFFTIPLLSLTGFGVVMMFRQNGGYFRKKDTKNYPEFSPLILRDDIKKLRLDGSESDQSDIEVQEITVSLFTKICP